jgi:hypothetical protein
MDVPGHLGPGLDQACPPWCRGSHGADDHPDDRHHQSPARLVAVVTGKPMLEPDDQARPLSVVVRLVRRTDSETTWLEIVGEEAPEVRLVVTAESARRLLATVEQLLSTAAI